GTPTSPPNWAGPEGDHTTTVSTVEVTLKDPAGNYWNGTTFTGTTESTRWQATTLGAGTWSYTPGANGAPASLTTNGTYTVHVRATDQAGNVATNATYTFTYDTAAPNLLTATTPAASAFYGGTTAYPTNWAGTAGDQTST